MRLAQLRMVITVVVAALGTPGVFGDDWPQFRGPGGAGVSTDANVPVKWSDTENLLWKLELPGRGASSPIVLGDRVFVTCYSGYGVPGVENTDVKSLQRHLVCVDRTLGKVRWITTIPVDLPEDGFLGYVGSHGYASHTPVSDGARVYCFFGKGGVVAFDLEGQQLWRASVGKESHSRQWGSGASPILYKDIVIVNASDESQSIRAFDKKTGQEVWKVEGIGPHPSYGTPTLVPRKDQGADLVLAISGEVRGFHPESGKPHWFAKTNLAGSVCASVVSDGQTLFVYGGADGRGSLALRAGGEGDVSKSHMLWRSRNASYVATPVLYDKHLYWLDDEGRACCVLAESGELEYRERVAGITVMDDGTYASPVAAQGRIYITTRYDGVFVLAAKPEYELLAHNRFSEDRGEFNATPAISNNQLFFRSHRFLYCVANKKP